MIEASELDSALMVVRLKLSELEVRQQRLVGRGLADADVTWQERISEVWARVHNLAWDARPNAELVAGACAHLLALLIALERAENADPATGEAA